MINYRICRCCGQTKDVEKFKNSIFEHICSKCYFTKSYKKMNKKMNKKMKKKTKGENEEALKLNDKQE